MPERPPPTPNRYQLPITSMVGAMLVVVGVVAAFVVWRSLNSDNAAVPVPTVDYQSWVRASQQDNRLVTLVPSALPTGWRATSASYNSGVSPHLHIGLLTADAKYVGLEEGIDSMNQQVQQYVDENAKPGPDVKAGGYTWKTWTDSGGDYALGREVKAPQGSYPQTVLVVGSAPAAQVREFAASLR